MLYAISPTENNGNRLQLIIIEFDSITKFDNWWNLPEYGAIAPLREESTKTNALIVEGV